MRCSILTLFPEMFSGPFNSSIIAKAIAKDILSLTFVDIRDFAVDKRGSVDDRPYGGGTGMILRVDVIEPAIVSAKSKFPDLHTRVIPLDPKGSQFSQTKAKSLALFDHLVLIAGHYEGVDSRVWNFIDESISIGDFILTGGELPAMILVDTVTRLLPGVLRNADTADQESFTVKTEDGKSILEYPQFTKPPVYKGLSVPQVLLSGNHRQIAEWRSEQATKITSHNRPDLLK